MTKESATKVENMEWLDGHYTGEMSDGEPHGHGTYTERLLYYEITINMRYQYSHQPDPTPQDAWQQGTVKQQRVRQISDNKWQVVYENTAPVYHPYEGEARKWLTDVLEDHGIETATGDGDGYGAVYEGVNFDPDYDSESIEIVDVKKVTTTTDKPDEDIEILQTTTYVGEWQDGKQQGQGTCTIDNGDKYADEWCRGTYVCEWQDGKQHGQGTYTREDGSEYVGEFKEGLRHGQGTYTYSSGDKYAGEWQDGKQHGQGTFTYVDGGEYVGEFKEGLRHGQGTYTYPSGRISTGTWHVGLISG